MGNLTSQRCDRIIQSKLTVPKYQLFYGDCMAWLKNRAEKFIHTVVTHPPFAMHEYTPNELEKLRAGRGGFGGYNRL